MLDLRLGNDDDGRFFDRFTSGDLPLRKHTTPLSRARADRNHAAVNKHNQVSGM
jgi:hypothetical protein